MSNLPSPFLWMSTPFRSETAWHDFLGMHQRDHYELARATSTLFVLMDDLRSNLRNHALLHEAVAKSLDVTRVADLESFDLEDESSFVSWHFLNASDHQRFRTLAGL